MIEFIKQLQNKIFLKNKPILFLAILLAGQNNLYASQGSLPVSSFEITQAQSNYSKIAEDMSTRLQVIVFDPSSEAGANLQKSFQDLAGEDGITNQSDLLNAIAQNDGMVSNLTGIASMIVSGINSKITQPELLLKEPSTADIRAFLTSNDVNILGFANSLYGAYGSFKADLNNLTQDQLNADVAYLLNPSFWQDLTKAIQSFLFNNQPISALPSRIPAAPVPSLPPMPDPSDESLKIMDQIKSILFADAQTQEASDFWNNIKNYPINQIAKNIDDLNSMLDKKQKAQDSIAAIFNKATADTGTPAPIISASDVANFFNLDQGNNQKLFSYYFANLTPLGDYYDQNGNLLLIKISEKIESLNVSRNIATAFDVYKQTYGFDSPITQADAGFSVTQVDKSYTKPEDIAVANGLSTVSGSIFDFFFGSKSQYVCLIFGSALILAGCGMNIYKLTYKDAGQSTNASDASGDSVISPLIPNIAIALIIVVLDILAAVDFSKNQ